MVAFDKCVWMKNSDDIEVWTAHPQSLDADTVAGFEAWLDSSERAQAARFRWIADGRSYIVAHALQRWLLGRAVGCEPVSIRLGAGAHGKPALLNTVPGKQLFFNLSRTRQAVACAISRKQPVGVDLESIAIHAGVEPHLLDPFITHVPEHLRDAKDESERTRQLFLLWTVLEAYWKAQGSGLASGCPRLAVRVGSDAALEIRHEGDAATDAPRARARYSNAVAGHVLSVAVPFGYLH